MKVTISRLPDGMSLAEVATKMYRVFGRVHVGATEKEQDEKPMHVQIAEIRGHIHNRDYGLAELKAEILMDQLAKGDWTLGNSNTIDAEDSDVFLESMQWRIKNIEEVSERDGETQYSNGQKGGFQYAVAIYQDCKKRGVI